MLICHFRHLLQHLHFFLIILSSLYSFSFAERKFCGTGLADTLKLLCRGKYRPRLDSDPDGKAGDVSNSLTQECCHKACSMKTLMGYCASPPDPQMEMLLARLSLMSANKGSSKASSGGQLLAGDTSSTGLTTKSRLSGLINTKQTFDVSPLLEMRPSDIYQSLPSRQR
ncbi:insulin-like growth factor isoform X2 [Paramacrobiotus metropolitanus]|nr:insulin-like growth factor isoform X2 [Paramacrobiotus metropolitanus]